MIVPATHHSTGVRPVAHSARPRSLGRLTTSTSLEAIRDTGRIRPRHSTPPPLWACRTPRCSPGPARSCDALVAQRLQAQRAVAPHAGQQHADDVALPEPADALEKHVDRRAVRHSRAARACSRAGAPAFRIRWSLVPASSTAPRLGRSPSSATRTGSGRLLAQPLRHAGGELLVHMLHDHDRRRKIPRQAAQHVASAAGPPADAPIATSWMPASRAGTALRLAAAAAAARGRSRRSAAKWWRSSRAAAPHASAEPFRRAPAYRRRRARRAPSLRIRARRCTCTLPVTIGSRTACRP